MAENLSFSQSLDELLEFVRPHGRRVTWFPSSSRRVDSRQAGAESLQQWFARLVRSFANGDPSRCAIERRMAVFASLFWREDVLVGANISTLVTSIDIEDYYLDVRDPYAVCLRLDLDYKTLGQPFSHPLPHIHFDAKLSPRFGLDTGESGNVVFNYFDFLYRNFEPSRWKRWAERVWNQSYFGAARPPDDNPFPTVMKAFEENQFAVLREHRENLVAIKKVLREAKDGFFDYPMALEDKRLLDY